MWTAKHSSFGPFRPFRPDISLYKTFAFFTHLSSHNHTSFNTTPTQPSRHQFLRLYKMRSSAPHYAGGEYHQPHFLDSCFLCHKHLSQNSDIYMYRGNTPFCSQECRQEQIEMDESNEKRWRISSSSKRANAVRQSKESSKESDTNKAVRTGTVAVA